VIIRNATDSDIRRALADANGHFGGNLRFKRYEQTGVDRSGRPIFAVTLTVLDSHGSGTRIAPWSGRAIAAACPAGWVHCSVPKCFAAAFWRAMAARNKA
jgi:hypothetical protein